MTAPRRTARAAIGAAGLLLAAGWGCASTGSLEPLDDPAGVADDAERETSPDRPHHVTLTWEFADERGAVEGDGVMRFNPPDSMRLDLFSTGDASMSAALVPGSGLRVAGRIEEVQLPPPPFLYASAGLLRPGGGGLVEALRGDDGAVVLVYESVDSGRLRFRLEGGRLVEVEERRDGRPVRRTRLTWPDTAAAWPSEAEYRDRTLERRARWRLEEVRPVDQTFPPEIYDLPEAR